MKIKILGTGCPNCQKLENNLKQAIAELKIEAEIEKISDISEIMAYNIMNMPVLIIDEEIVFSGLIPEIEEIKKILES